MEAFHGKLQLPDTFAVGVVCKHWKPKQERKEKTHNAKVYGL